MDTLSMLPAPVAMTRSTWGKFPVWILEQENVGRIVVADKGATLLSWTVPGSDFSLVDGFKNAAELDSYDGYRNAILAPWSNRIRNATYRFNGKEYDLGPDENGVRDGLHGLVAKSDFVRDERCNDVLSLVYRIEPRPAYPFTVEVRATYSISCGAEGDYRLSLDLSARNLGDEKAPIALGWHPYLRLPEAKTIDNWSLTIPARTHVLTDNNLIPLPGDSAWAGDTVPVRFKPLAGHELDRAYTDLVPDVSGVVRTTLMDKVGRTLTLSQAPLEATVVHVFTADPLERDPRGSVAVEPCTHLADAFNRPELATSIGVEPGHARGFTCDLTYKGR